MDRVLLLNGREDLPTDLRIWFRSFMTNAIAATVRATGQETVLSWKEIVTGIVIDHDLVLTQDLDAGDLGHALRSVVATGVGRTVAASAVVPHLKEIIEIRTTMGNDQEAIQEVTARAVVPLLKKKVDQSLPRVNPERKVDTQKNEAKADHQAVNQ